MIPWRDSWSRGLSRWLAVAHSLRFRVTVAVAAFIILVTTMLSVFFVLYLEKVELRAARREAEQLVSSLATDASWALAHGDIAHCREAVDQVATVAAVMYASISRGDSEVATKTRSGAGSIAGVLRTHRVRQFPFQVQSTPRQTLDGTPFLDFVAPILIHQEISPAAPSIPNAPAGTRYEGMARVAYSLAPTLARVQELRWRALSIAVATILLGLAGTTFLVSMLVGPLQDLVVATRKVADGEFDTQVPAQSNDEIGTLAESFNVMAKRVREAYDRQRSWNRELESRVREKTREIEETQRQLANIVENVGASVIVADLDGTIVSVNSQTTWIFGVKPEWITGRNLREYACNSEQTIEELVTLLRENGTIVYESGHRLDDHRVLDLLMTTTLLREPNGTATGILQIAKDISGLKLMERRLFDTERLSAMGEMAGEIGHELNNYLTAIVGRADLIPMALDRQNLDLVRQNAQIIAEQVRRMRVLTDGLLDSARKESSPQDIDLRTLVEKTAEFARPQNRYEGIQFAESFPEVPIHVFADPQQLQQVFLNLLANAADAIRAKSPSGGRIGIDCALLGEEAVVRISDDGAGIDEKILPRIFEPRFTTKSTGNGFGLAVCHRVVRQHGGDLRVESALGKGTTMSVVLPRTHASSRVSGSKRTIPNSA